VRRRSSGSSGTSALRELLTGAVLREIAGIRDAGEAFVARVVNLLGGDHVNTEGDADVLVHYEDQMSGYPGVARLFFPLNALWGVPDEGDSAMVLRGAGTGGPAAPYLLFGDAGKAIPAWIRAKVGLWHKKTLRVESTEGDVEVEGQTIKLGPAATKGVARLDDTCDAGTLVFTPNAGTVAAVLVYLPPGSVVPPAVPPVVNIPLSAKISAVSSKVKAE
jgi:hypothetical protein